MGGERWLKKGVRLLSEEIGEGPLVERLHYYLVAIRLTLSRGDVVRETTKCLGHNIDDHQETTDDGFLNHRVRFHRENFVGGLFYTLDGMRVGGCRKVEIAPHLAYGERGVPGIIPPNAMLTAEIRVLAEADEQTRRDHDK